MKAAVDLIAVMINAFFMKNGIGVEMLLLNMGRKTSNCINMFKEKTKLALKIFSDQTIGL